MVNKRKRDNNALVVIIMLTGLVSLGIAVRATIDQPTVYQSWSTRECVRVEPASAGDCDSLPNGYHRVWVQ